MRTVHSLKSALLLLVAWASLKAEVHSLTFQQALEIAARQSPEVTLARLDQQHAQHGIDIAVDPFRPKMYLGSGAAYTFGYPNSIDGNAPSLAQVKTDLYLFNRPKSYNVASAREEERGARVGIQAKAEDVAYQAAGLFMTAAQIEHEHQTVSSQIPSLQKVLDTVNASLAEGNVLPIEAKRATVNLATAKQRIESADLDGDYYQMLLAVALGYPAEDRVRPIDTDLSTLAAPPLEQDAMDLVLAQNRELKQMQSNVLVKELDVKSYRSARLPQIGLVAQYAYFAKYNYQNYFQKFQSQNFQLGLSFAVPILIGTAAKGSAGQAEADMQRLRVQMLQLRNRLLVDTKRDYDMWKKAQTMRELMRQQLDLAREELTIRLAQSGEGQLPLNQLEAARLEEGNRWIAFYEADMTEMRARLAILKQTGTLLASVRSASAPFTTGTP